MTALIYTFDTVTKQLYCHNRPDTIDITGELAREWLKSESVDMGDMFTLQGFNETMDYRVAAYDSDKDIYRVELVTA